VKVINNFVLVNSDLKQFVQFYFSNNKVNLTGAIKEQL